MTLTAAEAEALGDVYRFCDDDPELWATPRMLRGQLDAVPGLLARGLLRKRDEPREEYQLTAEGHALIKRWYAERDLVVI